MENEKKEKQIASFLLVLFIACAFLSMCSCAPRIKYIERVKTDSVYIHNVKTDSVYIKDSIFIDRSGDTIYKEVWRWRIKESQIHDTTTIARIDSIPYPVEIVKYVKKKNGFTTGCTVILFLLFFCFIAYTAFKIWSKSTIRK